MISLKFSDLWNFQKSKNISTLLTTYPNSERKKKSVYLENVCRLGQISLPLIT